MLPRLRLLIVTHAPLSSEYGAAQIALNLADGLREVGHDVTLWSPHPLPARGRWWTALAGMRRRLDEYIAGQAGFDAVDAPASLVTRRVGCQPLVLVRSVQPDLRYLYLGLYDGLERSALAPLHFLDRLAQPTWQSLLVLAGWRRADLIMCLGALELEWMERHFPRWREKLCAYVVAPSTPDQERIGKVRAERARRPGGRDSGIRFLWIGRWVAHKGKSELVQFARDWLARRRWDRITVAGCGAAGRSAVPHDLLESERVEVVPEFAREALPALLARHDAGLFTSKVEGWGLALNEMLESGMPVYATRAGGVPDLAPLFGGRLRPFPPDALDSAAGGADQPDWSAYYRTFSWTAIARDYAAQLADCRRRKALASGRAREA